jgi:hypothetical protein
MYIHYRQTITTVCTGTVNTVTLEEGGSDTVATRDNTQLQKTQKKSIHFTGFDIPSTASILNKQHKQRRTQRTTNFNFKTSDARQTLAYIKHFRSQHNLNQLLPSIQPQ